MGVLGTTDVSTSIATSADLAAAPGASGGTDVAVADGGTGASTAANARTNLGLGTLATQSGTFSGTSSGTNTGDQTLSDATISTTDITTNNVSTTKHGFAPKAPNDATKYLDGTGAYSVPPGGGGSVTKRVPISLDTPDASANGYPALSTSNGFSNVRRVVPAFTKLVDGTWEGAVRIPADYASGGKVVCSFVANAAVGAIRTIISTAVVAVSVTEDTAYTAETAVNTTVPGTAKQRLDISTTLTPTCVANSTLNVKITRQGSNGGDTLAVDALLWEIVFEYTT